MRHLRLPLRRKSGPTDRIHAPQGGHRSAASHTLASFHGRIQYSLTHFVTTCTWRRVFRAEALARLFAACPWMNSFSRRLRNLHASWIGPATLLSSWFYSLSSSQRINLSHQTLTDSQVCFSSGSAAMISESCRGRTSGVLEVIFST